MMKKLLFGIFFFIVSIPLTNGLLIVNSQQENIQEEMYPKTTTNLTQIFGEPIYKATSTELVNSIILNLEGNMIKTQDTYSETGILKDVGNVTDESTYITTYQSDSGNTSTSTGKGIITTTNGEIATYTAGDLGITDKNGTLITRGIEIFQTDSNEKLAFLDNLIGLYEYKDWSNGTQSGFTWEWK
jgi:hypothetical protein